ncbi:IclR family transcriptional regulator [Microbacterium sp. NEAU-LLC]|uniref:IclR family transcriptional regulator n=1 Tax=Microbacterium helvum TaxID=2773713 RepID=A0ABR8NQG3_9MICO|nr:IclR family transcriptional regulator [Microbacterium helvum]MBD3942677.1 IclR family transcriptional regulator [Microbacterium helvum]
MEQRAMSYHSQGLSRGLAMLRLLGEADGPLTLAQFARMLDLPKSTLVRILAVMEEEGFVRRFGAPPAYSIGHTVHEIAERYRPPSVAEVAAPVLRRLAEEVGFTTNIGVLDGRFVLHLHVEEPQRALRFATSGTLEFAYCTGLGKMLLSTLPEDEVDAHLPEQEIYTGWTPTTITSKSDLVAALQRIRKTGYSIDDEERNRGVTCMAVLLPSAGPPVMSLSVSAPTGELQPADQKRILPVLNAAAAELVAEPRFESALGALRTRMAIS